MRRSRMPGCRVLGMGAASYWNGIDLILERGPPVVPRVRRLRRPTPSPSRTQHALLGFQEAACPARVMVSLRSYRLPPTAASSRLAADLPGPADVTTPDGPPS